MKILRNRRASPAAKIQAAGAEEKLDNDPAFASRVSEYGKIWKCLQRWRARQESNPFLEKTAMGKRTKN
jgi:hypothetical protein